MPARLRPYLLSGLLLAVAVLLSVLLAGEWLYLKHGRENRAVIKPAAQLPLPEDRLLPDDYALPGLSQYQQMAERPLFMESRRPSPPAPPGPPPPAKPEVAPPINFKVMGILATPEGRMTLIADAKGKYKRMKVKDALDGWQIAEIKKDTVSIEQAGFREDLSLLKKRAKGPTRGPGQMPAAATPAPPGRPGSPTPPARPMPPNPSPSPPGEGMESAEEMEEPTPGEAEEDMGQNPEEGQ
ncbi:MAG: hypothetical protein ACKN9W_00255 [Methylococcus sp.]